MLRQPLKIVAGFLAMCLYSQVQASITLNSTRLVFEGDKKEASITVRNAGKDELLIQSWLDNNKPGQTSDSIPFAVTPPLARMKADSRQVLRVLFQGSGVPTDKESVFWLNVQEIPQASKTPNTLQVAVRQRIKFFYRPAGLAGNPKEAAGAVTWQIEGQGANSGVRVSNPSLYHVSVSELQVKGSGYTSAPVKGFMVAPGETQTIAVPGMPTAGSLTLSARSINDYGSKDLYSGALGSTPVSLKPVK
ncbi:MAG: molecular chaperone [Pseudomonadota bacterium]